MQNRRKLEEIEKTAESLSLIYRDIKSKTTQGKLRTNENHAFINNKIVISSQGRFVTEEEQKANLDLWVLIKDNELIESLYFLKNVYKRESSTLFTLCGIFVVIILVLICSIIWLAQKLP